MDQIPPYILVVGHGRSGTNWLLDILDASSVTHCRNEPNEVAGSALEYVKKLWYSSDALDEVVASWDEQVAIAKISMSERDHHIATPKVHIRRLSLRTGLASWPVRPKIRRVLRLFLKEFRQGEWLVPSWISNRETLGQSCAVLKINMLAAGFIQWHASRYPHVPILHIIRHPKGYFNSSIKRHFSTCTDEELESERRYYAAMLKTAASLDSSWNSVLGNIDGMTVLETVAWFWRVNNEMIYSGCRACDNYNSIVYENIVADPLLQSRKIYDFCGLEWSNSVEQLIKEGLDDSVWGPLSGKPMEIANAWKTQLAPEHAHLMDQVLMGSLMQNWWSNQSEKVV